MKRLFSVFLTVILILTCPISVLASSNTLSTAPPSIEARSRHSQAIELNVSGSDDTYFLEGRELTLIETKLTSTTTEVRPDFYKGAYDEEQAKNLTADVKVYRATLTDEEVDDLLSSDIIAPMSGPLSTTKQEQNYMGNIRATLKVTYSRHMYDGYSTLHLCKATGTYTNLKPPPNEGVSVQYEH